MPERGKNGILKPGGVVAEMRFRLCDSASGLM